MPENIALYLLLVFALGLGFLLGRFERRGSGGVGGATTAAGGPPPNYYQGLNYLLDERHELAVDALIDGLEVDAETFATHLALGALLRRRGETDKAIRLHQNLLASTRLTPGDHALVNLELARDFLSAGLLDRAETWLKDLLAAGRTPNAAVQALLLDLYVRERDWDAALPLALAAGNDQRRTAVHVACERAEDQLRANELEAARQSLDSVRRLGVELGRLHLVGARIDLARHDARAARKSLRKSFAADPQLIDALVPLYRQASLAVNEEEDYIAFLELVCNASDSAPTDVAALHERAQFIVRDNGIEQAQQFLMQRLVQQPSLAGLIALLELVETQGLSKDQLSTVLQYCRTFLAEQPGFRCGQCGLKTGTRHWLCPGCRTWGNQRPLQRSSREKGAH